jgi:hypothetical protein
LLVVVACLSAVIFLFASPDKITLLEYVACRSVAAVCFTVAVSGLVVASAVRAASPVTTAGGDPPDRTA